VNPIRRIHIYGHGSAQPQAVADLFGGSVSNTAEPLSDLAIFAINPAAGIDQATIELWQALSDFQLPRLVVVNELEGSDSDFDDAVLIANRVFDSLVTPYLVLHSEAGDPIALIDLATLKIIDYNTTPPTVQESDDEHKTLVADFRAEYLEAVEDVGESACAAGLLFPAIPISITKGIGVDIVTRYIEQLP